MTDDQADQLLTVTRDIRSLLRLGLTDEIDNLREAAFDGDSRRENAYTLLSKGESYRSIGETVGVSHATVGKWVEQWKDLGLVDEEKECLISPKLLRTT